MTKEDRKTTFVSIKNQYLDKLEDVLVAIANGNASYGRLNYLRQLVSIYDSIESAEYIMWLHENEDGRELRIMSDDLEDFPIDT